MWPLRFTSIRPVPTAIEPVCGVPAQWRRRLRPVVRALPLAAALLAHGLMQAASAAASEPTLRSAYSRPPATWPAANVDAGVRFIELGAWQPPAAIDALHERRLARLGARLFFDPRLSDEGRVSCASCHRPETAWTLNERVGLGQRAQAGQRNPPTLYAVQAQQTWGWDGRSLSLAAQSLRPLIDPREMGHRSLEALTDKLREQPDLASRLHALSGKPQEWPALVGQALAAYVRTLHRPSRFDHFVRGEYQMLSDLEIQGLHLFRTRARCVNCHFGPALSDGLFHNLGLTFYGEPSQDLGRHAVTGVCDDAGRFRTPSLRHVAQTAPYMHNGLFRDLKGVLHLYARGGGDPRLRNAREAADPLRRCAASVSPLLKPLRLSESDLRALQAFLGSL